MSNANKLVVLTLLLAACGQDAPAAPEPTPTPAPPPSEPKVPSPPEASTSPRQPTPFELAEAAMNEARYEEVCAYLATEGFSDVICGWIVETARANDDRALSTARFERFLRDQHVRRVSGSIVGLYDAARNEYEARIGGRTAILVATETGFETTGRVTMWAQQYGTSDEVLSSGREVSVPVYREWPLCSAILAMARERGDSAGPAAVSLLGEILRGWVTDYCYLADPDGLGDCQGSVPPGTRNPETAAEASSATPGD